MPARSCSRSATRAPEAAPQRTAAGPAPLAEGGRGLQLVEMVMDEVELRRGSCGSLLRFVKRRAEAA
ncbi:hypothetical protein BH20ACT19_BH20ACT19_03200 [soil metagenome]